VFVGGGEGAAVGGTTGGGPLSPTPCSGVTPAGVGCGRLGQSVAVLVLRFGSWRAEK